MSKGKKMNKEKAGGRGVQMKVFTFRKKTTPETQPKKESVQKKVCRKELIKKNSKEKERHKHETSTNGHLQKNNR